MGYTRDWITSGMKKIGSGKVSKESEDPKATGRMLDSILRAVEVIGVFKELQLHVHSWESLG